MCVCVCACVRALPFFLLKLICIWSLGCCVSKEAKNCIIIEHDDERFRGGMKRLGRLNNSHPFKEDCGL